MAVYRRIELLSQAWQACVLTTERIDYGWKGWIRTNVTRSKVSGPATRRLSNMAGTAGLEPATLGLTVRCSTNWAMYQHGGKYRIRTHGTRKYDSLVNCCFKPLSQLSFLGRVAYENNSTNPLYNIGTWTLFNGAGGELCYPDLMLTRQLLYFWATPA